MLAGTWFFFACAIDCMHILARVDAEGGMAFELVQSAGNVCPAMEPVFQLGSTRAAIYGLYSQTITVSKCLCKEWSAKYSKKTVNEEKTKSRCTLPGGGLQ